MSDEKKKLEKDALNDEQVSEVSGGEEIDEPVVHYDDPEDELHAYPMGTPYRK